MKDDLDFEYFCEFCGETYSHSQAHHMRMMCCGEVLTQAEHYEGEEIFEPKSEQEENDV